MKRDISLRSSMESPIQQDRQQVFNDELERFPILVRRNVQLEKTSRHTNPGLEIVITEEGRAAFMSRGKLLLLNKRRHVLLHNAELPHQVIALADKSYRCTALYIHRDMAENQMVSLDWFNQIDLCQLELDAATYSQIMEHCRITELLITDKKTGWKQLALSRLLQISVLLERSYIQALEQSADLHREEISALVQQCVEYVYDHPEEKLSLIQLAGKFSISREHLTRSFTKQLGVSFHRFVMGARIDYAKQLMLDDPELTVVETALLAGFATQSHFSNIFRSMSGCSPTQYRQQMKGKKEPSL